MESESAIVMACYCDKSAKSWIYAQQTLCFLSRVYKKKQPKSIQSLKAVAYNSSRSCSQTRCFVVYAVCTPCRKLNDGLNIVVFVQRRKEPTVCSFERNMSYLEDDVIKEELMKLISESKFNELYEEFETSVNGV